MIYPLFCKEYNLGIGKPGVRILAHHIHAHALGSVAEEEKPLRNTMDNHLKGVATLDACREAVTPDGSPQAHPRIAPGYLLRGPWIGMVG